MKIGLYGGAFNPVHNGHIKVAESAMREVGLDKIIFIPTGNAPHKKETHISRSDRLNMLILALEDKENMTVSDYELNRNEVSYSADTVEHFKKIYPLCELYFIVGDDSYNLLSSWHEPKRITDNAIMLVFPREGADVKEPAVSVKMERVDISSSEIRERIKNGKDCRNLLPKKVFDYIIQGNLYR